MLRAKQLKLLILKRILASLVDLILVIIIGISLFQVFSYYDIKVEYHLIMLFIFLLGITLPVMVLCNTIGYYVFNIHIEYNANIKSKLLTKYFVYFIIFSGISERIYSCLKYLFDNYTIILLPITTSIRISITFLSLSFLTFLFTFGKANLLDLIFRIQFINSFVPRQRLLFYNIYIIGFIFVMSGVLEYKFKQQFNFSKFFTSVINSSNNGYYPIEIFGDYMDQEYQFVFQNDENTYNAISLSDPNSLFHKRYLSTRTISIMINSKTKNSIMQRKELLYKLLSYEKYSSVEDRKNVDQIIFNLYYYEYKYFYYYQYVYTYYYDTKSPNLLINGGPDMIKLKRYYYFADSAIVEQYWNAIAQKLKLTKTELSKYIQNNGEIKLPDYIYSKIKNDTLTTKFKPIIPEMDVSIIPLEKVHPNISFQLSYPFVRGKMILFQKVINENTSIYYLRDNSIINKMLGYN